MWKIASARQVVKQMNKLVNVLQATDLTDAPAVIREMVLLRVRCAQDSRTAVLKEAEIFHARVVDSSTEGFAIEATGDPEKLDEFIEVMRSYGEIEVARSGGVAMSLEIQKTAAAAARSPGRRSADQLSNLKDILNAKTLLRKRRKHRRRSRARRSPSSATAARATPTR